MTFTSRDHRVPRRSLVAGLILAAFIVLLISPGITFGEDNSYEATEGAIWSADMLVVEYTTVSIGAGSPDLFSNQGGSAGLQAKSLWSYTPGRELYLRFTEVVPGDDDLTLQVGDLALPLQPGDSSYTWEDVDVDWEDGQTIAVSIVLTSATVAPQPNSPASGAPTISGTAQVDETLTAATSGIADADGLDNVSYSYQWIAGDADISGATQSTYTLKDADEGKTIRVRVSFTDDAGNPETLTSEATAAVAPTTPTEPLTLTVTRGDQIQELDASWQVPASNGGSAITGYKVQWKEAGDSWDTASDVSEATVTGTSHTITGLTGGVGYAVRVIATNGAGDGPASSEVTATPAGGTSEQNTEPENSPPTGAPTISGTAQVDQTLTADMSAIADDDGLTDASFTYQWIRNNGSDEADIQGATASTYDLSDADVGKTIMVRVSFTDDANNKETLTSTATAEVSAKPNSPATGQPTISGTTQVGETLTAATSAISDADGLTNVSYNYQWLSSRDTEIQEAMDSTYTLVSADEGKIIKVRVSFTDDADNPEDADQRSDLSGDCQV